MLPEGANVHDSDGFADSDLEQNIHHDNQVDD